MCLLLVVKFIFDDDNIIFNVIVDRVVEVFEDLRLVGVFQM